VFGPIWLLALTTRCRLGELLALRWTDVQLDSGKVTIRRTLARINRGWVESSPKTQAGERTITIPSEAVAALRHQRIAQAECRLLAGAVWMDDDRVFSNLSGGPVQACWVEHAITEVCDGAGLPRVTPHGLRHLHASLLLGKGLPLTAVSARLGHASPHITMSIYAHALNAHDSEAADLIGKLIARS
jgi:integrase